VLESHRTHDMDSLALRHLGIKTIKYEEVAGKGAQQIGFDEVALDKAAEYAAEDADITLRLHQAPHPQLVVEKALEHVYRAIEVPIEARVRFDSRLLRSPDGRRIAWTDGTALNVWDACARRALQCAGPVELGAAEISPEAWRPDGRAVRTILGRQSLLMMSAEDGSCVLPGTVAPTFVFYSDDGTKMGWLDHPFSGPDRTLWMADGLARGAVALASGPIVDAFFSADTRFLVIRRLHDSTGSIGVIDLNAANPVERPIASSAKGMESVTETSDSRDISASRGMSRRTSACFVMMPTGFRNSRQTSRHLRVTR